MEPKLPMPTPSPESGGYRGPEVPKQVERRPGPEQQEVKDTAQEQHEALQAAQPAEPVVIPALPQAQVTLPQPPQDTSTQTSTTDASLVAADDNLIEKTWVDKAKKIVEDTKSDPYKQEDEVSKLQADYLKKRYGKNIKLTNT